MKVVDTRALTQIEDTHFSTIDSLLDDVFEMCDSILLEGKAGRSKAEARAAKKKKAGAAKAKDVKRGGFDIGRAKGVEKDDEEHEKSGGKRRVNTKLFANKTTFKNTQPDALLHDKKTRDAIPASEFADPAKKSGPLKRGPSSIAGTLRQAYASKNPTVISKAMAAAKAAGMEPKGSLWNERDKCKLSGGKLAAGVKAKDCKPHGKGGPDEWLRRKTSHKTDKSHRQETRSKGYSGHGKLPKAGPEREHAVAGGHAGEAQRGFFRTLGPHTLKKLGAGGKSHGDTSSPLSGQKWRSLQRKNKAQQTKS